ncbi:MAG: hypothetical protein ACYTGC_04590 [Planctomycetota bacterium]|jgi:hypothetical protein
MPHREPDPADPSMLVGTAVECSSEELNEMAASFASELAQMGHDHDGILGLFRHPSYAGPNLAWSALGERRIREIVEESVAFWSRLRFVDRDAKPASGRPRSQLLTIDSTGEDDNGRA